MVCLGLIKVRGPSKDPGKVLILIQICCLDLEENQQSISPSWDGPVEEDCVLAGSGAIEPV